METYHRKLIFDILSWSLELIWARRRRGSSRSSPSGASTRERDPGRRNRRVAWRRQSGERGRHVTRCRPSGRNGWHVTRWRHGDARLVRRRDTGERRIDRRRHPKVRRRSRAQGWRPTWRHRAPLPEQKTWWRSRRRRDCADASVGSIRCKWNKMFRAQWSPAHQKSLTCWVQNFRPRPESSRDINLPLLI